MKELYFKIANDPELLIATIALVTSIFSILIGVVGLIIQREHNKKSVLPIGAIFLGDYKDHLKILIYNNGVGPLILKSCSTKGKSGVRSYPVDWMPSGIDFDNFQIDILNNSIPANESLTLLELSIDYNNQIEKALFEAIRSILSDLEITIVYVDIYGKKTRISSNLDWFGR